MSTREAAGYLVQLKDLYRLRLSKGMPRRTYRRLSATDLDALAQRAR
jgi:hypothetical protein